MGILRKLNYVTKANTHTHTSHSHIITVAFEPGFFILSIFFFFGNTKHTCSTVHRHTRTHTLESLRSLEMEDQRNINGSIKPHAVLLPTIATSQTTLLLLCHGQLNQSKAKQRNKQAGRGDEKGGRALWRGNQDERANMKEIIHTA